MNTFGIDITNMGQSFAYPPLFPHQGFGNIEITLINRHFKIFHIVLVRITDVSFFFDTDFQNTKESNVNLLDLKVGYEGGLMSPIPCV